MRTTDNSKTQLCIILAFSLYFHFILGRGEM